TSTQLSNTLKEIEFISNEIKNCLTTLQEQHAKAVYMENVLAKPHKLNQAMLHVDNTVSQRFLPSSPILNLDEVEKFYDDKFATLTVDKTSIQQHKNDFKGGLPVFEKYLEKRIATHVGEIGNQFKFVEHTQCNSYTESLCQLVA